MKSVSIILPCWRRTPLLANTLDSIFSQQNLPEDLQVIVVEDAPIDHSCMRLCGSLGVDYYARRRGGQGYSNVGAIYNIGIKRAHGDIVIMQSAECKYEMTNGLHKLIEAIEDDELKSAVPCVQSIGPRGHFVEWYNHPHLGARAGWTGFFCHALHRSQLLKVQGYDEVFQGYGHDDDLLLFRLKWNGVVPRFVPDVLVTHQWHQRHQCVAGEDAYNHGVRLGLEDAVRRGHPNVANASNEWGAL